MTKKASKTAAPLTGFDFFKIDMKTLLSTIQAGAAQGTRIPGGQESSSDDEGSEESSVESEVEVRKEKGKKEEAQRTEEKKKVRGSNGPVPKPRAITKGAE